VTTNLAIPDWQNYGDPTNGTSVLIDATNDASFYRIIGQ